MKVNISVILALGILIFNSYNKGSGNNNPPPPPPPPALQLSSMNLNGLTASLVTYNVNPLPVLKLRHSIAFFSGCDDRTGSESHGRPLNATKRVSFYRETRF